MEHEIDTETMGDYGPVVTWSLCGASGKVKDELVKRVSRISITAACVLSVVAITLVVVLANALL